ncbi:hypothetical protein GCM10020000_00890 [Streptomyces olivoverticillatus]
MALTADQVPDTDTGDPGAGLDDLAGEFVADHERGADHAGRPVVPAVDVQVGTADAGAQNLDQYLPGARLGGGNLGQFEAGPRGGLHQCLHEGSLWPVGHREVHQHFFPGNL